MKTVLITGASGFIATNLLARLKSAGHRVIGVTRSAPGGLGYDRVFAASLGDTIRPALDREQIDAVVHTANHSGADTYRRNVDGTTRWFEESSDAGVNLQILLSSLSAASDSASDYGLAKFELERLFTQRGHVAARLGVVVGDGGMFARMVEPLRNAPLVPLLDGGRARVHVLGIDELCGILTGLVDEPTDAMRGNVLHLQQPTPYSLRQVMHTIRRQYGLRCRFVSIPSLPVLWLLTILERLPLQLPITATNVRGLRLSRHDVFPSDFERFVAEEVPLNELVRRVVEPS